MTPVKRREAGRRYPAQDLSLELFVAERHSGLIGVMPTYSPNSFVGIWNSSNTLIGGVTRR
jgi:hypothetical protein